MADQPSSNPVDVHAEASPVQSDATQQHAANVTQTEAIVEKKGSPISQMIDKDGNYIDAIQAEINKWGFADQGFNYYVVAILGCQSSGKSTLLNRLFSTSFEEMNAKRGRSQTTQGVWVGYAGTDQYKLLVLDVEGTDSRERGEEHGSFERKTSLFSLALAEVLMINMWVHDVGRFEGANYGLLKIVFELNLQLFQSSNSGKTLLLFMFRDHIEQETPIERLMSVIHDDMNTIWEGIAKPEKFKSSKISDFFDFGFLSLPHKVLVPERFETKAAALKERFLNPSDPENILQKRYRKAVPADGFSSYAKEIWHTIQENKDLDLPTQKEMLAMVRCEEIMNESYAYFVNELAALKAPHNQSQLIEHFGANAAKIVDVALERYDNQAQRYHEETNKKKRAMLLERMSADLLSIFNNQMKMSVAQVQKKFNKNVKKELKEKEPTRNFLEIIERIRGEISTVFDESIKDSLVSHFNWDMSELKGDFEKFLTTRVNEERQNQMTLILQEVNKISEKGLSMQLNKILDRAEADMWSQIRTVFETAVDSAQEKLESYLKDFKSSSEEISAKKVQLRNSAIEMVNKIMREKAGTIVWYMERKFNNKFKLDAQGVPRMWKPADNIKLIYVEAKRDAEKLIDLFSIVRLHVDDDKLTQFKETETGVEPLETPPDVPETLVVLPLDQAVVQLERFRDQSQVPYLQALREQENAKTNSSVPLYFIILLLILGFDEFMAVISNPIYFILTIILGGAGYIIYKFNLTPFLMPVVRPIADVMLSSAATVSKTALDRYLANKNGATPPPTNNNNTNTDTDTPTDSQTKKDQ